MILLMKNVAILMSYVIKDRNRIYSQVSSEEALHHEQIWQKHMIKNYINFGRVNKALIHVTNNLIDSDNNMYLPVDSYTDINNIITGWHNITLKSVSNRSYGCDETYTGKDLREETLYQLIYQFN